MRRGYSAFGLAWLLCFALLVARSWLVLQQFQLFAEDGSIFLASAWNSDLFTAIATPYAGYYHLLPRLAAEAATLLPYAYTPWTYALMAVAVNATAISWLQLPHYRWLIRNDWLRLGVVALIAFSPNMEAVTTITYLQWALAWWAVLVTLMPLNNVWLRVLISIVYLCVIWTAPILVLLIPIWVLRLWYTRSRGDAIMIGVFAFGYFSCIAVTMQAPRDVSLPIDLAASITDLLRAYAYRVTGANILGVALTEAVHVQWGWSFLHWFAGVVTLMLLVVLVALHPRGRTRAVIALLYVAIASLSFYLLRSSNFHLPFLNDDFPLTLSHRRYFFLASASLFVLLGMLLDELYVRCGERLGRPVVVLVLVLFALPYAPTFVDPANSGPSWSPYGQFIDLWHHPQQGSNVTAVEASSSSGPLLTAVSPTPTSSQQVYLPFAASTSADAELSIPISPQGWFLKLQAPSEHMASVKMEQGLIFVGSQTHAAGGLEHIDLFWQYAGEAPGAAPTSWQVALSLVDAGGTIIACQPIHVALPNPLLHPEQLFFSEAVMPLPVATAPGDWRLTVTSSSCPATTRIIVPPP